MVVKTGEIVHDATQNYFVLHWECHPLTVFLFQYAPKKETANFTTLQKKKKLILIIDKYKLPNVMV